MQLTVGQYEVLRSLNEGPRKTKSISNFLNEVSGLNNWSYDCTHGILRRLENRELVRRLGGIPAEWELTPLGRRSIQ